MDKIYKIIRCPYCKTYQSTSAKSGFKCIKCLRSKKLANMRIYYKSENPNEVVAVLKEIKKEKFKLENPQREQNDDFESAL